VKCVISAALDSRTVEKRTEHLPFVGQTDGPTPKPITLVKPMEQCYNIIFRGMSDHCYLILNDTHHHRTVCRYTL